MLNFKDKKLKMADKTYINKSFLITEEKKVTLGTYLEMNPDEFCANYDANEAEYIEMIKGNFREGEKVNTRPTIFFLRRQFLRGVDEALEAIHQLDCEKKLSFPLKSFFGRNKSRSRKSKQVDLVIFDRRKINIDQMRVVYNAMVNRVTYVKGPPGTGKTETIFNVLLSAYANDKTVLVCSNNNHPVSEIYQKMDFSITPHRATDKESKQLFFPMMRLGNTKEMRAAITKLRVILSYIANYKTIRVRDELTEISKKKSLENFNELKDLLMEHESQVELRERIESLLKIRTSTTIAQINEKLDDQIGLYQAKLRASKDIRDRDVLKYAISAAEDIHFQNYVFYSALQRFKKLASQSYKDLREIIEAEILDDGVVLFNKWLKNTANLKRFLAVFPIIICTNLSCEKLGSPSPHFDLVVMDEAGQCNVASSLIPIVRGTNLLLVGDTNQLQPVTVIEQNVNEDLMARYKVSAHYDYVRNSILSTMLRKDNNSKNILLRYHYRCGKKIANFVNQRFYEKKLKLLNENPGDLIYINVKNRFNPEARNSYKEEAIEIAKIIKKNKYKDVGIVTPFVNQAALLNEALRRAGIADVSAGTIHTLQGSEKSVIIMSAALSLKTGKKTLDWINNNHELINVAVTRAKEKFIFVGDKEAIDKLSGEQSDIKILSDYVHSKGEVVVPKSEAVIVYDFSNDSKNEKDFFETVQPYFNRRGSKFKVERNVPLKQAIKGIKKEDLFLFGRKEFDVIVKVLVRSRLRRAFYRTIVAFEIDGGEHIGSQKAASLDRQKEEVCRLYGIKLIRIPNSAVKDYVAIISLFETATRGLKDFDKVYSQMSLFGED